MRPCRRLAQQAGFSLLEVVVAAAILSIVAGGAVAAFAGAAKFSTPDPARTAAEHEMRRLLTLAADATKYTAPADVAVNTTPWNAALPSPTGTPFPVQISAAKTSLSDGGYALTITIAYPHGSGSATLSNTMTLVQKAPPPDATLSAPGTFSDPRATPTP